MKKLLFSLVAFLCLNSSMNAQAPSYTDFEWDILRLGYAIPGGASVGSGLALGTEVRYNLKDNISVGLRWEVAIYGSGDETGTDVDLGAAGSYALMGDYYFNTESSKRAFAGLGIGMFQGASVEVSGQTGSIDGGSSIGIIPRIGYEFGHLRISGEYNLTFDDAVANYIGIHIGITLFGGYDG